MIQQSNRITITRRVFDPSSRWPSEEDLHRRVDIIHTARVMRVTRRRAIVAATRQRGDEVRARLGHVTTTGLDMPPTTPPAARLSDAEVERMLALMRGADSVELKLTVPEAAHRSTVTALGMDPLDAEIRQVFFFDTPELALDHQGVVVRARRIQRRDDDSVVKLRPVVPDDLPSDVRTSKNLVVEVDAMPGGYVCSAALKRQVGGTDIQDVAAGTRAIRTLYSKEQRRFFAANTTGGMELDDLSILGPITILKLKFRPKKLGRRMVAELWHYPDGSQILELSTKCAPAEAFQVAAESRAYLAGRGVDLSGNQQTKTRTALEYFSSQLSDGPTE